ncbi:MAG: hypothetical protein JWM93_2477 [Frankiales bacterium]|nr:hypothetical protein [Frankiales bacterium]
MTIIEFLEARLRDDQAAAEAATPGPWVYDEGLGDSWIVAADGSSVADFCDNRGHNVDAAHAARFDPARVLAECAAKRRIIEGYKYLDTDPDLRMHAWTFALRCLAQPYADHPDYRQEWAP